MEYRFRKDLSEESTFRLKETWTTKRKHFVGEDDGTAGEAILDPSEYDVPQDVVEELIRDHDADRVISETGDLLGELNLHCDGGR